jgi:hypothetical protein
MAQNTLAKNKATSTEVATRRQFDDEQLLAITDFATAYRAATDAYGDPVVSTEELGTGFKKIDDKSYLVDKPFLALMWEFHPGDYGDEPFVAVHCVTEANEKLIFVDGSTGIRDALQKWSNRSGRQGGMLCPQGLRDSEFHYCEDCKTAKNKRDTHCPDCGTKLTPATTYYIA